MAGLPDAGHAATAAAYTVTLPAYDGRRLLLTLAGRGHL
jgi:hypothetical protein